MNIPLVDRTYIYDPDTVNPFLRVVEMSSLTQVQKKCALRKQDTSHKESRKLPFGCVTDVECIRRWFLGRKDCPSCRKGFRLVKKWMVYEEGGGMLVWEDDDQTRFI